jgi:hypothetical protein
MKKKFISLAIVVLVLNLIWEFSHYSLYIDLSGIPSIPHLFLASFTDMLIISGIFLIISIKNKTFLDKKLNKTDYFLVIFFGLIIAASIEIINLNLGRWAYTELMPTIFGIGLSPLIQLFTTAIISLKLVQIFD